MNRTEIQWSEVTWNPVTGCDRISPGCDRCYALTLAARLKAMGQPRYQRDGDPRTSGPGFGLTLHEDKLSEPLTWRKPRLVFVNSMSDLFHKDVPPVFIAEVFAAMAQAPQHTFQCLTKRPKRMRNLLSSEDFPHMVAKAIDRQVVSAAIAAMGAERTAPIEGFPGYLVTDRGRVLLEGASETCLWCRMPLPEDMTARRKFCCQQHNAKAFYERSQGRWQPPAEVSRPLRPDAGEQGHLRVTLIGPNGRERRLVHRLVLDAFVRVGAPGEQGCHRNGDATINALPNLRWGTQADNWADRIRHGNHRTHRVRDHAATWITPDLGFEWPLPNCWLGVSIESRDYVWRADRLRETPAAVRFISAEPLLGPLTFDSDVGMARDRDWLGAAEDEYFGVPEHLRGDPYSSCWLDGADKPELDLDGIDWLIVGGESGPNARPMRAEWARDLRDRCQESGAAFFFKQHGGRTPKAGGRLLDGRTWDEMPEVARVG